jgi:hypothetical protein
MPTFTTPTDEQVNRAVARLIRREHVRYFLDRLDNPHWLKPLRDRDFFRQPYEPEVEAERNLVRYPTWPASRYLVRIAAVDPAGVVETILEAQTTTNIRVLDDYIEAARSMPAKFAAALVNLVRDAMPNIRSLGMPEEVARLVSHLARGGEVPSAMTLAQRLFELRSASSPEVGEANRVAIARRALSNMSDWDYQRSMEIVVPDLAAHAGLTALDMFGQILEMGIRATLSEDAQPPSDISFMWRPAIEDHEQNRGDDYLGSLVWALRETAAAIALQDPGQVDAIVERLERRPWIVFRRVVLHLLATQVDARNELVARHLTDHDLFDDDEVRHEYNALARRHFPSLTAERQGVILGWVEAGPDLTGFRDRLKRDAGREPTEDEEQSYIRHWLRNKLAPLSEGLTGDWQRRWQELVSAEGVPEAADFAAYMTTGWARDETLPVELDELGIDELVEFLRSWEPTSDFMSTRREGVGRNLATLVARDPAKYTPHALRFRDLRPVYVRSFFEAIRQALQDDKVIDWPPVLLLAVWVLEQRDDDAPHDGESDREPGWRWVRDAVAEALSSGFEDRPGELPFASRDDSWRVLLPLTEDPNPTPEHERECGGSNMDPLTLSLNTTRGKAMHALMRYVLWVARRGFEKEAQVGLDKLPEVGEVLERHLDPDNDPAVSVRAVYGQWLPSLTFMDAGWVAAHLADIFPDTAGNEPLRNAAWDAYILTANPWDLVLQTIRPEYERAIDRLGQASDERANLGDPADRLASHVLTWYWQGKDSMDDQNGLLMRLYRRAPDEVRSAAMDFIGRSLKGVDGELPVDVSGRLVRLAEWRLDEAEAGDAAEFKREMTGFGWWYTSRKLDRRWSLEGLRRATAIAKKSELDHWVMEALAEDAEDYPGTVLTCISAMIEGDDEGWHVHVWRKELTRALTGIFKSGDTDTQNRARQLVDLLGGRGYIEFRDVLPES